MKKTNKSKNPKTVCTGYAAPATELEDIFPHFKRNIISLFVIMGIWYVAMAYGNRVVINVALWFSVVFILFLHGLVAINVISDVRDVIRIWDWINGNTFVQKCRCILGATIDRVLPQETENIKNERRINTIMLVLTGVILGILGHLTFLYSMCIILEDGLFGSPVWLWSTIIISQLVATPAFILHLGLPLLINEITLYEDDFV